MCTCSTADYFFGNSTNLYDAGLTVRHVGALNVDSALQWSFREYGSASDVFVAGWGAGGYGAALWSGKVAEQYSSSLVTLLIDSATDVTALNATSTNVVEQVAAVGLQQWRQIAYSSWKYSSSLTPVTALASIPASQLSIETLIAQTAAHFNSQNFRVARFNFAKDNEQVSAVHRSLLGSSHDFNDDVIHNGVPYDTA